MLERNKIIGNWSLDKMTYKDSNFPEESFNESGRMVILDDGMMFTVVNGDASKVDKYPNKVLQNVGVASKFKIVEGGLEEKIINHTFAKRVGETRHVKSWFDKNQLNMQLNYEDRFLTLTWSRV